MKGSYIPLLIGFLVVCVMSSSTPVAAHHSFAAQYDRDQPVKITGKVTKVEWTNPHVRVLVDSTDATGTVEHWRVELSGNMTRLSKVGWKADSLKAGETVTVDGFRARRSKYLMNADTVMRGATKMFAGGEGPAEERAPGNR
jgi:hypothetical protein